MIVKLKLTQDEFLSGKEFSAKYLKFKIHFSTNIRSANDEPIGFLCERGRDIVAPVYCLKKDEYFYRINRLHFKPQFVYLTFK